jgi:hypothetical protein
MDDASTVWRLMNERHERTMQVLRSVTKPEGLIMPEFDWDDAVDLLDAFYWFEQVRGQGRAELMRDKLANAIEDAGLMNGGQAFRGPDDPMELH